jgi:hypothetical protein
MDVKKMQPKFNFRDEVKDIITGFVGKILCIGFYDTGCIHYSLQRGIKKDESVPDWQSFDESRLILVKAAPKSIVPEKRTSGPVPKVYGI